MAGFLINSRGTTIMIDPLLKGFDMPVIIEFPIKTEEVPKLDAILVTHSDNDHYSIPDSEWHFTFEGAVKIANAYPNTPLLLCHWGSVDAPNFAPFNGDPEKLKKAIINPERIHVLAPGQPNNLTKLKGSSK